MKLKKVIRRGPKIEMVDLKDSTMSIKPIAYILLDDVDRIVDTTYYKGNKREFEDLIEGEFLNTISLYQPGDKRRYNIIDMLLPYTSYDIGILKDINYLMNDRYKEEHVLLPLFESKCYKSALERWDNLPGFLVNVMSNKQDWLRIPVMFIRTIQYIVSKVRFAAGINGIAFLNGLHNSIICGSGYLSLETIEEIVYEKLKVATIEGHQSFVESYKVIQVLNQTGNLFDFKKISFNQNEATKICNNLKREYGSYSLDLWEKNFKAYAYNDSFINIMIKQALPKCLVTNNKYVSHGEERVIMKAIDYLKQYCDKDDYSISVDKLRDYEMAPDYVCSFRDIDSTLMIANLMTYSDFNKYASILFEYRVSKVRLYSLDEGRSMFSLLHSIYDKRKFIKLAKLMLKKLDSVTELSNNKKNKLRNELNYIISYHNVRYSDQKVDIEEVM